MKGKIKMKKIISIIMCVALLLSSTTAALATDNKETSNDLQGSLNTTDTYRFVDGEGKDNKIITTILNPGEVVVKHFIDDELIIESTVNQTKGDQFSVTESINGKEKTFYVDSSEITKLIEKKVIEDGTKSYSYQGRTVFNPIYAGGQTYNYQLRTWYEYKSTDYEYRSMNIAAGYAAASAIGIIAGVLSLIFAPVAVTATALVEAAAIACGTTIVGGIIQGVISKTYYVKFKNYDVKVGDVDSSRIEYYSGEKSQTALVGGGYSSSYFYDGYMPWNSNHVAYWSYSDFWTNYPGVSYYTSSW